MCFSILICNITSVESLQQLTNKASFSLKVTETAYLYLHAYNDPCLDLEPIAVAFRKRHSIVQQSSVNSHMASLPRTLKRV